MQTKTHSLMAFAAAALMSVAANQAVAGEKACGPAGSWVEFKAKVAAVFPAAIAQNVTGVAKERIVARYNSTPPATKFQPDHVRYLTRPDNPVALIVLEKGGCVVATAHMPVALLHTILAARPKGISI